MSFSEWKEVVLGDVVTFNPRESIPKKQIAKKIAMEKLKPFTKFIDNYEFAEFKGGTKFRNGDTLLARITPCLENGKTSQVTILDDNEVGFGSTEYIVLREKVGVTNKDYIYYLSISPKFRDIAIKSMVGSSGRQRVQQDMLQSTEVLLPSLIEQKSIADTLSCLDDKIELNNRINKTLEEMAQAIFKNWFVDFEPFQDGEFEGSELGMIPKGWSEKALYDFAEYINGTSFKKDQYSDRGCPIVKITELKNGITSATQYFSGTKDEKYYIKTGDILFSWSGNPQTSIDTFIWCCGDAILNQHTFKISIKNNDYCFLYLLLKFFKPEFTRIASSKQTTGLGHVTVSDLKRLKFPYNHKVVSEFCILLNPVIQMYVKNLLENKKLNYIRDTLLPKLMSGEIRVPTEEA
ncbi:restriction endonuclease subunit S [uncultured Clostridium sp.]|uniref:restriction endonuclease subunit S n=1 Tax=uncultured Clostridium sp. TaxID=59620 RepID=UPI0028EE0C1C|nr:restriction endonuclease subunit S [uncultured Clostridium sp.]